MKSTALFFIAITFLAGIFGCSKNPNNKRLICCVLPNFVEYALNGTDSLSKMSVYYLDAGSKHYIMIESLIGDTLFHREYGTTIKYGNFRSFEMFYRASDTVLPISPSEQITNTPTHINDFTLEVFKNGVITSTHHLSFQVHRFFDTSAGYNSFKYSSSYDGSPLTLMTIFQFKDIGMNSNGRIGFVIY